MPQPVDLQTELGRTTLAERVQDAAGRASLAAHQRAHLEEEEARIGVETQVQETKETQAQQVDARGRRKNPFVKRRKKRKKGTGGRPDGASKVFYTAREEKDIARDPTDHDLDVTV